MKHGSLFSGIGGFDLAAEWMGWENVFHCEIESFPQKILKYYWPNSISYEDIKKTDFTIHRGAIDILTGGFPCQPYSSAGKRLGKEDERHLWPEMLRAIQEISPRWIVGENVRGLLNWNGGLVFDEVQSDLETEGYEVQPFLLPAAAVNAPHRRDRIWFVAYSDKCNDRRNARKDEVKSGEEWIQERNKVRKLIEPGEVFGTISDTFSERDTSPRKSGKIKSNGSENDGKSESGGEQTKRFNGLPAMEWDVTNPSEVRPERRPKPGSIKKEWAKTVEQSSGFCELSQWEKFPTQPAVCSGNDGIPNQLDGITFSKWRNESIKGYGNAVVPQVVYQIFKAIEQYESEKGNTTNHYQ